MLRISRQKTRNIKIFSVLMAMLMLFCCIDFSFIYAEGEEEYSNTLNEWYVQATWNNDSTEYNLSSSKPESLYPKLTVRYYINQALREYKAGDIVITIPGIGGVKRGSVIEAETTTTQTNTEWNMTYDSSKDTYTFTNKNDVLAGQTKSGGFEMMWELYSRDGENGYNISNSPSFSLEGGEKTESITLPELKFSYTSERDKYNIDMTRSTIQSSEFESVAQGVNDRIWYKYTTKFTPTLKARGLYKSKYFVKVGVYEDKETTQLTDIDYSQIEVYFPSGKRTQLTTITDPETGEEVYGFYTFTDKNSVSTDTFYLGLPKEIEGTETNLEGKTILVQSSFIALYNDETEYIIQHRASSEEIKDEKLIDDSSGEINEYGFVYLYNGFWHTKRSTYDSSSVSIYSNRLLSNELYNSKTISYTLTASTSRNYGASSAAANYSRAMLRAVSLEVDKSDFGADTPFQFIQGDDRVTVELANGAIRQLENDEYNFAYVTIPRESVMHNYTVYVSDDYTKSFDSYTVYQTGKTSTNQAITVQFDSSVKAFYVAIEGVVGNYQNYIYVGINFHLDWDKEQAKPESERINSEGKIANFSYFRMVYTNSEGQKVNYASMDGSNYTGNYGLQIKADDEKFHNEYLYRKSCDVPLRTTVTNISSSTSSVKSSEVIQPSKNYGGGYVFNTTTSGTIQADESGELKKFSIYAVLQNDDMKVDENLKDIVCSDTQTLSGIKLSGSATTVEGKTISNFSDYVSYEVRKTTDGQTVVIANFDFTNSPLEISKLTSVSMTFPVKISQNAYEQAISHTYNVNSYTIVHDKGISKVSGKAIMSDIRDIDADGDLSEQIAYSSGTNNLETLVREWEESVDKFVATYLTDDYVHSSKSQDVEALAWDGKSDSNKYKYSYKLNFDVGNAISDAVFYDNIEGDEKLVSTDEGSSTQTFTSEWYGTFLSVDTSDLQLLGIKPTVYYSSQKYDINPSSALQDYTDTSVWTEMTQTGTLWTAPEGAEIKSIAVHLDLSEIKDNRISNSVLYAIVNMRTPTAVTEDFGKKTYNRFSVAFKALIGQDTQTTTVHFSEFTEVILSEERPKLIIKKYDNSNRNVLTGAKFTIYTQDEEGNYNPISGLENLEVSRTGQLVIDKGLKYEQDYYYRETTAPLGYKPDDNYYPFRFEKNEETKTIEVYNIPLTGTLYFTKKDADNAEYSDNAEKDITSLEGAEYSIYKYDGTRLFVNMIKSENGTNIYEYSTDGTISDMITGANGFKLTKLPWGSYYIIETAAPSGYELSAKKLSFTVQKNLAEQGADEIKISLSQSDIEKTASIKLTKTDSQSGDPLKSARFSLERQNSDGDWETVSDKTNITTNVMGELLVDGIKFGTYRLREINAPIGYKLDENPVTEAVTLDASTAEKTFELKMQNDRKTGSARMIKYSEDGKTPLAGAKYDLYIVVGEIDKAEGETNDRLIKRGLITDTSGMTQTVSGLEWGKYYFVEIYAPKGYKKSNEKLEFEITSQNVDIQQDITQTDTKILGSVKLTKTAGEAVGSYAQGALLPNVEFELYTKAGEQVKAIKNSDNTYSYDANGDVSTFVTDSNGIITVDKLPWDSYYFEETKALDGFSLADKVRFTVNAGNCNSVQELECENKGAVCSLKIEKEIDTSIEDFGTPTFLFKIKKIDNTTSYTKSLTIKNGTSGSFTLLVDPGEYLIEEIKVARYKPKSVEIVAAETTTTVYSIDETNKTATVTLSTTDGVPETACVKFTNELYRYDKVSHNSSATNIIAANRKITGISAEYTKGEIPLDKTAETSTYTINKEDVKFKILYDDGSEEEITSTDTRYADFVFVDSTETVDNGINSAGQTYQVKVQYTDSITSKTYKSQFDVEVAPLKVVESIKVIFKVDAENSCYFSINNKRTTANVVYYNEDDDGNKIAVSGIYYEPITIDEEYQFYGWIDSEGNLIATSEDSLKQYLKTTDKTELTLYAKISLKSVVQDFNYTGDVQEFTAPYDGYYQMECWGANGGNSIYGGTGAYTSGYIYMKSGETVYIYVGEKGINNKANYYSYNGGGAITYVSGDKNNGSGGGATDIRLVKDTTSANGWSDFDSLKSRIMVAGGGGGGVAPVDVRGYGGTLESNAARYGNGVNFKYGPWTKVATQTSGYKFGIGETKNSCRAGAGGGYYGGFLSNYIGSGGSSFISGYNGCDAISGDSTSTNITHTGQAVHYSGKYFINGVMKAGNESMPDYNSEGTITGNNSNGHARITYINPNASEDFDYTGEVQTFTAPQSGTYILETWGASGGGSKTYQNDDYSRTRTGLDDAGIIDVEGGRGGYTTATVYLTKGQTVYIAVGGMGRELYYYQKKSANYIDNGLGFNGGGIAKIPNYDGDSYFGGGGGATHIALTKQGDGQLVNYKDYQDEILVVAGGGGGSAFYDSTGRIYWNHGLGGAGGGLESQGNHDNNSGVAGRDKITISGSTQTSSGELLSVTNKQPTLGSFGQGASLDGCGGGGGWYGGSATFIQGGAGGSGHIGTETLNGTTIAGTNDFLAPDGTTETGHAGNGYARITFIRQCQSEDFDYTGEVQTFTAPQSGTYMLETWGAQGGGSVASKTGTYPNGGLDDEDIVPVEGGRGGYTTANVYLTKGQTIYIAVGGKGMEVYGHSGETNIIDGGYNGGGIAKYGTGHSDIYNGGGGGATHIALTKQGDGQLVNYKDYQDEILVVAGGGGGSGYYQNINRTQFSHHGLGGAGGGLESQGNHDSDSISHGKSTVDGSTQTDSGTGTNKWEKGSFGQGASYDKAEPYGSGGGGGWYGGSSTELQGGAGGSGHINTGTVNGKAIIGTTIAGTNDFLAPDGTTETGHIGNGYARITLIE